MLNPIKEAKKIIQRFGIVKAPIDVQRIAEELGAKVIFHEADEDSSGMIYASSSGVVIGVNNKHFETRQRFTIAHEIGHLVMHSQLLKGGVHVDRQFGIQLNRDKRASLGNDYIEIQANKFAAELLMPSEMLRKEIKNEYFDLESEVFVKKLATQFNVSQQAMSIKLFQTFTDFSVSEED